MRRLSPRETEILRCVADGLVTKQIARQLGVAVSTVKTTLEHAMLKLDASTRSEAVAKAMTEGLL